MVAQVIASDLFGKRSKISSRIKGQLLIRGGGVMVDDALRRFGWASPDPVVTSVLTCEIGSGVVRASRFETRGSLGSITFGAKELWSEAESGVTVSIKLDDLSVVTWPAVGAVRNQSEWLEDTDLDISFKKGGAEVAAEDIARVTVGGRLALRLTILPGTVDTFFLFGGIVPCSVEELREKLVECGQELSSPLASTIAVKLQVGRGKSLNGRPIKLLPTEDVEDGFGLGHLPLLELIGGGVPVLPDHDDLEKELTNFLRAVQATNNVAPPRLLERYTPDGFPSAVSGRVTFEWPAYRGPVGTAPTRPATGERALILSVGPTRVVDCLNSSSETHREFQISFLFLSFSCSPVLWLVNTGLSSYAQSVSWDWTKQLVQLTLDGAVMFSQCVGAGLSNWFS